MLAPSELLLLTSLLNRDDVVLIDIVQAKKTVNVYIYHSINNQDLHEALKNIFPAIKPLGWGQWTSGNTTITAYFERSETHVKPCTNHFPF